MTDTPETTGTAGSGVAWSEPLPEVGPNGERYVYVGVPNHDSLALTAERMAVDMEQSPRIHAMNMVINRRQFDSKVDIEDILKDAKKVERYIRTGKIKGDN